MPVWEFRQLAGEKRILNLDDYAAPFGRPRQKPLMREIIHVRVQTTKYPGSKNPPTRHIFGSDWEDMELEGRWMTKALLPGSSANKQADDWIQFIRDEQPVRMSWGNIISYDVFIDRLELGRESEHDIAWKMKLLVDRRADEIVQWFPPVPTNISDGVFTLLQSIVNLNPRTFPKLNLPDMNPSFLEKLDFFAGQLNQYAAEFNNLTSQLADIQKAAFSTIQHFRSALTGFQTAILNMRDLIINLEIDSALMVRNAESDIKWLRYAEAFDVNSYAVNWLLSDLERQMEILTKGEMTKLVTAREGDNWEKISERATGGPDKASAIREANGIRFGTQPEIGQAYLVP